MPSKYLTGVALVILCAACMSGGGSESMDMAMDMASDPAVMDHSMAPMFEVDPLWPKPLAESLAARLDDRRGGGLAGSRLDHPPREPGEQRDTGGTRSAGRRGVLLRGSARSRVRCRGYTW